MMKSLTLVSRWLAWIGGALILASAILVSLDVVFRTLFRSTVFESFELSSYAFAIATSLGMAFALMTKAHIRIEVAYNALGLKWRGFLDVLAFASLAAVALVLAYWCLQVVVQNGEMGARSNSSLALPLILPQSIWLIGIAWFAIVSLALALVGLAWLVRRQFRDIHDALGVGSLQEEISASIEPPPTQSHQTAG